jgi:hypothetical protein
MNTKNLRAEVNGYGYYNNKPVVFFTLQEWDKERNAWIFRGKFTAPRRTPKSKLVQHAVDQIAAEEEARQAEEDAASCF